MTKHDRIAVLTISAFSLAPILILVFILKVLLEPDTPFSRFMNEVRVPSVVSVLGVMVGFSLLLAVAVYAGGILWILIMKRVLPLETVRKWACYGSEDLKPHVRLVDALLK